MRPPQQELYVWVQRNTCQFVTDLCALLTRQNKTVRSLASRYPSSPCQELLFGSTHFCCFANWVGRKIHTVLRTWQPWQFDSSGWTERRYFVPRRTKLVPLHNPTTCTTERQPRLLLAAPFSIRHSAEDTPGSRSAMWYHSEPCCTIFSKYLDSISFWEQAYIFSREIGSETHLIRRTYKSSMCADHRNACGFGKQPLD